MVLRGRPMEEVALAAGLKISLEVDSGHRKGAWGPAGYGCLTAWAWVGGGCFCTLLWRVFLRQRALSP